MLDALFFFEVVVGALVGLVVAFMFHWFAPPGTDTVSAGAWFVGLGSVGGVIWFFLAGKKSK